MKVLKTLLYASVIALPRLSLGGEVAKVCRGSGISTLELEYRRGDENFKKIRNAQLGNSPLANFLKEFYSKATYPLSETQGVKWAFHTNQKLIKDSDLKSKFMRYATTGQRTKDPDGYMATIVELLSQLVPEDISRIDWFLRLKDKDLAFVKLRPANGKETGDVYGAVTNLKKVDSKKFGLEVVFSNYESEPLPYLLPLLVHELVHASSYKTKISLYENHRSYTEMLFVEEARAFDLQMQTYLKLATKSPEIFCNWIYPTWSYGEIPVPLSWAMASMEKEMAVGRFMYNYAKMGSYKDSDYLLNSDGTDLRDDLTTKIKLLRLKFIR